MLRTSSRIAVGIAATALVVPAFGQALLRTTDVVKAGQNVYDRSSKSAVDGSGNVYVAVNQGATMAGASPDIVLIKYTPDGQRLWSATFDGPSNGTDSVRDLAVDAEGNVYLGGVSRRVVDDIGDFVTIKYSLDGLRLWTAFYNSPYNQRDEVIDLAVDPSGNVVVTGTSQEPSTLYGGTGTDFATVKYSPKGEELWSARYDGPGNATDTVAGLAIDASGNVAVTGTVYVNGTLSNDIATIVYRPDGTEAWNRPYSNANYRDAAREIAFDSQGNVVVLGITGGYEFGADILVAKYSPTGDIVFTRAFNPASQPMLDEVNALAIDAADNILLTGFTYPNSGLPDVLTAKFGPNGTPLWTRFYAGAYGGSDFGTDVKVDTDGNAFVLVNSPTSQTTGVDVLLLKYAADGTPAWVTSPLAPLGNGRNDNGVSLNLTPAGTIAIAGTTFVDNYSNAYLALYDQVQVVDDAYSVDEDGLLSVTGLGVRTNDRTTGPSLPSAVLITGPQHGALSIQADGTFVYRPNADYSGPDSFTYRLNAHGFSSTVGTVRINVNTQPDAPVARPDSYRVAGNAPTVLDLLANDSDADGDAVRLSSLVNPAKGQISIGLDNSVTYTPNTWAGGPDTFSYTVHDGTGRTSSATITVEVFASDVSGEVTATASAAQYNRKSGFYERTVTLQNVGSRRIPQVALTVEGLSGGSLSGANGTTAFWSPGSGYFNAPLGKDAVLSPGERVKVVLRFSSASAAYSKLRVVAGAGRP